jgi:hypothetical protein
LIRKGSAWKLPPKNVAPPVISPREREVPLPVTEPSSESASESDDHHHLVCRRCGRVEDIDTPLDLEGARRSAKRMGFAPDHAEVVVSGLCAACAPQ